MGGPARYEVPINGSVELKEIPVTFGYSYDDGVYKYSFKSPNGGGHGPIPIVDGQAQPREPIEIEDPGHRQHLVKIVEGDINRLIIGYIGHRQMRNIKIGRRKRR